MRPILTIAIPTWNRAEILNQSLERLFPQLRENQLLIEVIISDNASTDNTYNVVVENIRKYRLTNVKYRRNENNIGHYGNYRMCRKHSIGEYLWLLSDDDHVKPGIINEILIALQDEKKPGGVYLDGWGRTDKRLDEKYHNRQISIDEIFVLQNIRPTLLSSTIFLNNKDFDKNIEDRFNNSAFLCLSYFVNTKRFNDRITVLCSPSLEAKKDTQHTYNWFKSFVEELGEIYVFMYELGFHSNSVINLANEALKMIVTQYIETAHSVDAKKDLCAIKVRVSKVYSRNINYYKYFIPASIVPIKLLIFAYGRLKHNNNDAKNKN
jgi:glycosyltransferase involved in cell wall biosynthesis